jgi:hypothetical protein
MLSNQQCDEIIQRLDFIKTLWEPRGSHEFGELHTVGAVSAFGDIDKYQLAVKQYNKDLWRQLAPEYGQILDWVRDISGCEVYYDPRLGLPGFQIFTNIRSGGDRELDGGIIHKDYLWDGREIAKITGTESVDEEYSATIILSPEKQYLDIWDNFPDGKRELAYERGVPTMHDHQLMHQVPYIGDEGFRRYSMQIRGFRVGNRITLYL